MIIDDFVDNLEDICEKYFNGLTKPKHLKYFDEITPKGNHITGYINQKPNHYLGSMLIITVNNEAVEQFIQAMPKINYFNHSTDILKNTINPCYEKLDGSCLILYPLKDHDDEIIEIVPKTRGRPVADKHFVDLYSKVDRKPIEKYYQTNEGILLFELYGILNQHEIIHYDTGIDLALISIYDPTKYINLFENNPQIIQEYGFKLPDKIFEVHNNTKGWFIEFTSQKYKNYLPTHHEYYPTNTDLIEGLKEQLNKLNEKYYNTNGRLATEGVVINTIRDNGSKKFIKCKPTNIESKHRASNGILKSSIKKECFKYFDEYGSEVKEIYNSNPKHHTEYLHRQLSEEYSQELINKSKNKIERIFMSVWDSKEVPTSIHTICEELINDNPDKPITELMRIFSSKYPQKKKDSRLIYSVLEKKL